MYITFQKEEFNLAYLGSLAAHAGLKVARTNVDDDSVDVYVVGKGFSGTLRNPQVHLQLKSTSSPKIKEGVLKFQLDLKNYDDLRATNVVSPQYLIVMCLPIDVDAWIDHGADFMKLQHCCYWVSIRGAPESVNSTSVTVDIPISQRLDTAELLRLVELASNGESA